MNPDCVALPLAIHAQVGDTGIGQESGGLVGPYATSFVPPKGSLSCSRWWTCEVEALVLPDLPTFSVFYYLFIFLFFFFFSFHIFKRNQKCGLLIQSPGFSMIIFNKLRCFLRPDECLRQMALVATRGGEWQQKQGDASMHVSGL